MLRLNNLHGLASMWAVVGHNLIFHGVKLAGRVFVGHARRSNTTGFIGLCDTDDLRGIDVPGMPAGSPGMEVDGKHDAYKVIGLSKAGTDHVIAEYPGN